MEKLPAYDTPLFCRQQHIITALFIKPIHDVIGGSPAAIGAVPQGESQSGYIERRKGLRDSVQGRAQGARADIKTLARRPILG